MGVSGDIDAIGRLAHRVDGLPSLPTQALEPIAFDLAGFLEEDFSEGHDPYGNAWTPLSPATLGRGRRPPPLTDTGVMRATATVTAEPPSTIRIAIDHPAAPHQTGWKGVSTGPARPMVPAPDGSMPPRWAESVRARIEAELGGGSP